MPFRVGVLSLVLVPAISWADAPVPGSPAQAASPMSLEQAQAEQDHRGVPQRLPVNGRVRIAVHLGQAETAEIRLVENGQPVAFSRTVVVQPAVRGDTPWVELVPSRALQLDATVVVFVANVRSGTYRVSPADLTPPEVASVETRSFEVDLPAQDHTWGLGRPARDEVQLILHVLDEGAVRVRGVISRGTAAPVESLNSVVVATGVAAGSLLTFPPGSIPKSGPGQLRIEAVDVAGNVGWSKPIELGRPAPAASGEPSRAPEPAPRPVGRGCG